MFDSCTRRKDNVLKILALIVLTAICVVFSLVVNINYNLDVVYTHLFYLPIAFAGIWYHRKSIYIAAGLGALHIYVNFIVTHQIINSSVLRAIMFLVVAVVISSVSAQNEILYKKLNDLNSTMHDMVAEVSSDGIIAYISPSCKRLLGYAPSELCGKSFFSLALDQDRQRLEQGYEAAVASHNSIQFDFMCKRKDGTSKWLESIANPSSEGSGHMMIYLFGMRDISERKEMEERLRFLSLHDSMTNLYNRKYFQSIIKKYNCGRFDPVGIIVVDINGLKTVNEEFGHHVGDKLILAASDYLASTFRFSDIIARIGGGEFVVLMPNCSQEGWDQIIERVTATYEYPIMLEDGIPLSLSIGYTLRINSDRPLNELFEEAETMMYEKKKRLRKE